MLTHIDPRPADTSVKVAFALKSEYGDSGFEDWAEWAGLETDDLRDEAKSAWWSASAPKNITISYVIDEARKAGWSGDITRYEEYRAELRERARRRYELRQARQRLHHKAVNEMYDLLNSPKMQEQASPYLLSKGINVEVRTLPSVHGPISLFPFQEFSIGGGLQALQLISPTGSGRWVKRFYQGSKCSRGIHPANVPLGTKITVACESVATAYAVAGLVKQMEVPVHVLAAGLPWNLANIGNLDQTALLIVDNDSKPFKPGTTVGVGEWYASMTHNRRWMTPDPDTEYADYVQLPDHPVHQELRSWILDNV